MKPIILAVVPMLLASATLLPEGPEKSSEEDGPCMDGPAVQFGRYLGDWKIEDEVLAQDGSGWGPGKGARWVFECLGDGLAIQDFWMPTGGGFGTNLRTYNPDTQSWEIVWAAKALKGLMHIGAKQQGDGSILMNIISPRQDPPRRIIFFPPDPSGWNWVQQWSFDEGKTWTDVYRIRATPWPGDSTQAPSPDSRHLRQGRLVHDGAAE